MSERLTDEEIEVAIPDDWEREGSEIVATFEFDDYLAGVEFAVGVAEIAEEQFHHPQIVIDYEAVTVRFTTHEADGITERDIELAELVTELR